ncbi:MAG TPA: elongation factor P maturation arginine rhamnosyltransferase EarP [Planctomycetaceae bacterium]|jgi:uncharacterized repeat protein (TIGR03837 family)
MPRWDIFCRVVDNYGDIGTCWRLARQLADEHEAHVRLWVDNLDRFACLCPSAATDTPVQHVGPIEVRHWQPDFPQVDAADVVIEAFACELPASYVAAMTRRKEPPVWINLEYLSAETWVEGCHLLPSPRPELPLTKYFFFPGFTSKTGGLLRERGLPAARNAFDAAAQAEFWRGLGMAPRTDGELRVSLFCYDNAALPELLPCWAAGPAAITVLAAPGAATAQVAAWLGGTLSPGQTIRKDSLTVHALPFLPQSQYDRLLWASDVNFVRGEDSFVRAQWAKHPFVWQIYPQSENAHLVKLEAFLMRYLDGFSSLDGFNGADVVRRCWQAWNGGGDIAAAWGDFAANLRSIEQHGQVWASHLDRTGELADNLARFVRGKNIAASVNLGNVS